jgi:hypothetical protein
MPGDIVNGEITEAGKVSRYWFALDTPRRYSSAPSTPGESSFGLCINASDAAGTEQGGPKCGDVVAISPTTSPPEPTPSRYQVHRTETGTFACGSCRRSDR